MLGDSRLSVYIYKWRSDCTLDQWTLFSRGGVWVSVRFFFIVVVVKFLGDLDTRYESKWPRSGFVMFFFGTNETPCPDHTSIDEHRFWPQDLWGELPRKRKLELDKSCCHGELSPQERKNPSCHEWVQQIPPHALMGWMLSLRMVGKSIRTKEILGQKLDIEQIQALSIYLLLLRVHIYPLHLLFMEPDSWVLPT